MCAEHLAELDEAGTKRFECLGQLLFGLQVADIAGGVKL